MNDACSRRWLLGVVAALGTGMFIRPRDARADGTAYWRSKFDRWTRQAGRLFGPGSVDDHELTMFMAGLRQLDPVTAIHRVNRVVNERPFRVEPEGEDHWEPAELTWREGGDCEDFALLKAAILAECGWLPSDLRLVIADVPRVGRHAFLGARAGGCWWRLDSLGEASAWDGGAVVYPGPVFHRLWLSPPLATAANRHPSMTPDLT
ncbi:MAG: transglutaminase-like cysteine peptidase [Geminicoccaceae bacterium]|nr:transglutaminase-like cysteine peptidase [Geminicoccaceae bacterium]